MSSESLGLFKALGAKMDYLNQRQRVISQNIANADTPGYKPQDLLPVDFNTVLRDVTQTNGVRVETTDGMHMPRPLKIDDAKERKQKETYEVAPAGNAVIMEEQLIKANQTVSDYTLMTNIYQKQVQMMKTALGRGG